MSDSGSGSGTDGSPKYREIKKKKEKKKPIGSDSVSDSGSDSGSSKVKKAPDLDMWSASYSSASTWDDNTRYVVGASVSRKKKGKGPAARKKARDDIIEAERVASIALPKRAHESAALIKEMNEAAVKAQKKIKVTDEGGDSKEAVEDLENKNNDASDSVSTLVYNSDWEVVGSKEAREAAHLKLKTAQEKANSKQVKANSKQVKQQKEALAAAERIAALVESAEDKKRRNEASNALILLERAEKAAMKANIALAAAAAKQKAAEDKQKARLQSLLAAAEIANKLRLDKQLAAASKKKAASDGIELLRAQKDNERIAATLKKDADREMADTEKAERKREDDRLKATEKAARKDNAAAEKRKRDEENLAAKTALDATKALTAKEREKAKTLHDKEVRTKTAERISKKADREVIRAQGVANRAAAKLSSQEAKDFIAAGIALRKTEAGERTARKKSEAATRAAAAKEDKRKKALVALRKKKTSATEKIKQYEAALVKFRAQKGTTDVQRARNKSKVEGAEYRLASVKKKMMDLDVAISGAEHHHVGVVVAPDADAAAIADLVSRPTFDGDGDIIMTFFPSSSESDESMSGHRLPPEPFGLPSDVPSSSSDPDTDPDAPDPAAAPTPINEPIGDPFANAGAFFCCLYETTIMNADYYTLHDIRGLINLKQDTALELAGSSFPTWSRAIAGVLLEFIPGYGTFAGSGTSERHHSPTWDGILRGWKTESSTPHMFSARQINTALAYHMLCLNGDLDLHQLLAYTMRSLVMLATRYVLWQNPFPFLHLCKCHIDEDDPSHRYDHEHGLEIYDTGYMRLRRSNEPLADIHMPRDLYCFSLTSNEHVFTQTVPRLFLARLTTLAHRLSTRPLTLDDDADTAGETIVPGADSVDTLYRTAPPRVPERDLYSPTGVPGLLGRAYSEWFAVNVHVPPSCPGHPVGAFSHGALADAVIFRDAEELFAGAGTEGTDGTDGTEGTDGTNGGPFWHVAAAIGEAASASSSRPSSSSPNRVSFVLLTALGNLARRRAYPCYLPRLLPHPYRGPLRFIRPSRRIFIRDGGDINDDYYLLGLGTRCVPFRVGFGEGPYTSIREAWLAGGAGGAGGETVTAGPVPRMFSILIGFFRENHEARALLSGLSDYEIYYRVEPGSLSEGGEKWEKSNAFGRLLGLFSTGRRVEVGEVMTPVTRSEIEDTFKDCEWNLGGTEDAEFEVGARSDILLRAVIATSKLFGMTLFPVAGGVPDFFDFLQATPGKYTSLLLAGEVLWTLRRSRSRLTVTCPLTSTTYSEPSPYAFSRGLFAALKARALLSDPYADGTLTPPHRLPLRAIRRLWPYTCFISDVMYKDSRRRLPGSADLPFFFGTRRTNPTTQTRHHRVVSELSEDPLRSSVHRYAPSELAQYMCAGYRELAGFDPALPMGAGDGGDALDMELFRDRVRRAMRREYRTETDALRVTIGVCAALRGFEDEADEADKDSEADEEDCPMTGHPLFLEELVGFTVG